MRMQFRRKRYALQYDSFLAKISLEDFFLNGQLYFSH